LTTIWVAFALAAGPAAAAGKRKESRSNGAGKPAARAQQKQTSTRGGAAARSAAHPQPKEPPPLPPPQGKLAVFTFAGEGGHVVQQRVINALRAKGMKVVTNLRPLDSAEQYREMALTLNLVAYVDGEFMAEGDQASATVHVRSGVTGMRAASTTFAGEKRTLPAEVGKGLWERLSLDLSRICVEAAKPRKAERAPLRIEAGTPLPNRTPDEELNQ
jgi:hypothetical protein